MKTHLEIVILIKRLLDFVIRERNKKKVEDAKIDPSSTLANNGRLHKSDKTFAELSRESKRDSTE